MSEALITESLITFRSLSKTTINKLFQLIVVHAKFQASGYDSYGREVVIILHLWWSLLSFKNVCIIFSKESFDRVFCKAF